LRRVLRPGFVDFFWSASLAGGLCKRQRRRKITNKAATTLGAKQAACQSSDPLKSMQYYTLLVNSGNDKNRQLTLLSQLKPALTAINTLFAL
jgi:hypothetical protein